MEDINIIKWILGIVGASLVVIFKTVWKFPEKYVLKDDFNNSMNSVDSKLDTIQTDIKQILKEKK
jgi:hypothetical protein